MKTASPTEQLNDASLMQMVEWLREERIEFELTTNAWASDQATVDQVTSHGGGQWVSAEARTRAFAKGLWCRATVTLHFNDHHYLYGYDPEELARAAIRCVMRERYGKDI